MDGYLLKRRSYRNVSTTLAVAATDGDTVLIAGVTNYTIYVQCIIAYIITDAAQSWSFEDTAGTPVVKAVVTTSPGANTRWEFDFGPEGAPLTEAKSLNLNVSAAGLAGHIEVLAYMRATGTIVGNTAPNAPVVAQP